MTGSYDPWLVLLSVAVSVIAASVALDLAARVVATRGRRISTFWLLGGSVSMGIGIWSMHFIGMLAFRMPMPMSYDVGITLASLLLAVAASGFALRTISRRTLDKKIVVVAGVLMGCAIASMHYLGMAAMGVEAPVGYRPGWVIASVAIAIGASILALRMAFALRAQTIVSAFRKKAGSALVMGIAISGMHYAGMAAAIFAPVALHAHAHGTAGIGMGSGMLAGIIGGFTFRLLATTLVLSMVEAHFAARAAAHLVALHQANAALSQQAAELAWGNDQLELEIDERMRSEAKARHQACHDGLTALPNRMLFDRLLSKSLLQATARGGLRAVMFIDLDRFKVINDTLGHEAGDALLRDVAGRLQQCVGDSGIVARFGGDEFVVLLPDVRDPAHAGDVARVAMAALVQPYVVYGQEFHVTASIGIAMHPADGDDERTLMRHADVAMYRAKADGKNTFRFYHRDMDAHAFQRLALETDLRHALERGQFELYYQPKIDATSGRIAGVEALLRWQHPQHGSLLPGEFLQLAEETGLIVPIGSWALRNACTQHADWSARGMQAVGMSVNLSACQFSDAHLLVDLAAILAECAMDPGLLELEITEGTLMLDVETAVATLGAISAMGVHIAIDGFGSGYAALATPGGFAIHTIKVDRSILRDLRGSGADQAVAAAVLSMGRALSTTVIAEGVETAEQVEFLRGQAYDQLQGFYFRQAMPAAEITDLLCAAAAV